MIVGILTFAFSALSAALSLLEAQLGAGISDTTVTPQSVDVEQCGDRRRPRDHAVRLFAIAALGAYLLWRGGLLRRAGLGRGPRASDVPPGLALAAAVGLPGLALVAVARLLGLNASLVPAETDGLWWRWPILILLAVGNGAAERSWWSPTSSPGCGNSVSAPTAPLASSALLRGGYHLYQGVGAGLGNAVMGLIFGRWYQLTEPGMAAGDRALRHGHRRVCRLCPATRPAVVDKLIGRPQRGWSVR